MPLSSISYSIPYFIFFLVLYLLSFPLTRTQGMDNNVGVKEIKINKMLMLYASLIVSLYFIGLRGYIFTDWISYKEYYDYSPDLFTDNIISFIKQSAFEKGYTIYIIVMKSICRTYEVFQFVDFIINVVLLYHFFKRFSCNILLSYVFYIIFFGVILTVNLQRNIKAILIVLNSFKYIKERKFIKFFLFILLAMQFHISAIFYTFIYFLYQKSLNQKLVIIISLILNVAYLLKIDFLSELLILASKTVVRGRFGILLNRYVTNKVGFISTGITIGYLERLFSFLLIYRLEQKLVNYNRENILFCNIFYVYYFFSLFCASNLILFDRFVPLFIFSYWILYPNIYKLISKPNKYLFIGILVLYGFLKTIATYNSYICYYDNLLFLKIPSENRLELFRKYGLQ